MQYPILILHQLITCLGVTSLSFFLRCMPTCRAGRLLGRPDLSRFGAGPYASGEVMYLSGRSKRHDGPTADSRSSQAAKRPSRTTVGVDIPSRGPHGSSGDFGLAAVRPPQRGAWNKRSIPIEGAEDRKST